MQATTISDISDKEGKFVLSGITRADSLMITAWKMDFYVGWAEAKPGEENVIIAMKRYPERDYEFYGWISPEPPPEEKLNCSKCHKETVAQWKNNLHSQAAVDPRLVTMYNGTDMDGDPNVEPGFKLDFPGAEGSCADCHAPTAALVEGSWTTDLNTVSGVDRNGVSCDYCHKIIDTRAPSLESMTLVSPPSICRSPPM